MNFQTKKYNYLNENPLVAWYSQYGTPRQAAFYPNLKKKRAAVMRQLIAEGVNIRDFNGYTVDGYTGKVNLPVYSRKG